MRNLPLVVFGVIVLVIGAVIILAAPSYEARRAAVTDPATFSVVTTTENMAHFVRIIGEGNASLSVSVIAEGAVEPHDFEPSAGDIAKALTDDDLFIAVGGPFDGWAKDIARTRGSDGEESLIILLWDAEDPHFWLDPVTLAEKISTISDAMAEADPSNARLYGANAENYIRKLASLDQAYETGLVSCEHRMIITTHDAFEYLAARYDIEVMGITGISHEEEPTTRDLARLVDSAKREGITTVFAEYGESGELAEALADDAGVSVSAIDTFEIMRSSSETGANESYLEVMEENLTALKTAMVCR